MKILLGIDINRVQRSFFRDVASRINPYMTDEPLLYTLTDAARQIGIAPITLKRWLLAGKVGEVGRNRNGWRVFSDDDITRIREYATRLTPPEAE